MTFAEYDHSPAAREIMREATRVGVTRESIGEWLGLAVRYERLGKPKEAARCARRAIEIHDTWGTRHAAYSMAEGTLAKAQRLAALV